jgi:ABC-type polysaccharide/polyol phosphate transport system ATPase subunit
MCIKAKSSGLIGRNGAGKTTLLKLLSRITRPTTGFAEIRGRVGSLLEVGTGFHPELTGRENIYSERRDSWGMSRVEIDRKMDAIVAFAEVERFLSSPLKFYSTGMQMRLAFAVAAHLEPEILLVDEVLAVGDLEFQKEVSRQNAGSLPQRTHHRLRQPSDGPDAPPVRARHLDRRRPDPRTKGDRRKLSRSMNRRACQSGETLCG